MSEIVDIHTHILPKLDDGAASFSESMKMLALACSQGVTGIIATPHSSAKYRNLCPRRIVNLCSELQERAAGLKLRVRIYPGQEVLYSGDTLRLLEEGRLLTLAGSRYVLTEFHPMSPYSLIYGAVRELTLGGYRPVLAHVERYGALREDGRMDELAAQGAYMQMNYMAVSGSWLNERTRWSRSMLKKEKIHFLGTDMHNMETRKPDTSAAREWMRKHLDGEYVSNITGKNAERIVKNELLGEKGR